LHTIFQKGRKVFVSRPINHFPLDETASHSLLLGGGIGITPMIAMAHRLYALGRDFELHYSGRSRASMAYLDDLAGFAWSDKVHLHISAESSRAKLSEIINVRSGDTHVYTCGAEAYMAAVMQAAEQAGIPEEARHLEYFSVPELPEWENHAFTLRLVKSGFELPVPADKSAAEVLQAHGVAVDVKCSDGICGVCQCALLGGQVEHRDFVLSNRQRESTIILCQSRASQAGGVVEVDL
ncbi:MAG: PDR/VanB family oxidoreductase, partial [Granulosicoccaceae bacterium]